MNWWSADFVAFELFGQPFSWIEIIGTISGFSTVWLATRANIWTWPIGILNELAFFLLFYQIQLYADMALQVFFLGVTVYGWRQWGRATNNALVGYLTTWGRIVCGLILGLGTVGLGFINTRVHLIWPGWFPLPASFPWSDAFTTAGSIVATILLSQKRIETWVLWMAVDLFCVGLYWLKGIHMVAFEYAVFTAMAGLGWQQWRRLA
jgi:nicotinamide mononucleotide transporter